MLSLIFNCAHGQDLNSSITKDELFKIPSKLKTQASISLALSLEYLGELKPELEPKVFAPGIVSTGLPD